MVPKELVPPGANVGSRVIINASISLGCVEVLSCQLFGSSETDSTRQSSKQSRVEPNDDRSATYQPGQVVWATVLNPIENESATGKKRPVVLVANTADSWRVMGLTTKQTYATGLPRVPIPDWENIGLFKPGYLWGHRLTRISADSVLSFIGYADELLVEAIVSLAKSDMSSLEVDVLRSAAMPPRPSST